MQMSKLFNSGTHTAVLCLLVLVLATGAFAQGKGRGGGGGRGSGGGSSNAVVHRRESVWTAVWAMLQIVLADVRTMV